MKPGSAASHIALSTMFLWAAAASAAAADARLVEAVKARNVTAVRALLSQHVDVNGREGDGSTALHWAVHLDDLKTMSS